MAAGRTPGRNARPGGTDPPPLGAPGGWGGPDAPRLSHHPSSPRGIGKSLARGPDRDRVLGGEEGPRGVTPGFRVLRPGGILRIGGADVSDQKLDEYDLVPVDGTLGLVGHVPPCAEIQRWIGNARTGRLPLVGPCARAGTHAPGNPVHPLRFPPLASDPARTRGDSTCYLLDSEQDQRAVPTESSAVSPSAPAGSTGIG